MKELLSELDPHAIPPIHSISTPMIDDEARVDTSLLVFLPGVLMCRHYEWRQGGEEQPQRHHHTQWLTEPCSKNKE
jgi:hypothetical protein